MSAAVVERVLAELYSDASARTSFLADSHAFLRRFDLTNEERDALLAIDRAGLVTSGNSIAHKTAKRGHG